MAIFRYLFSKDEPRNTDILFFVAWILFILGHVLLFVDYTWLPNLANGGVLAMRSGYIEVFYPPCPAFLCATVGVIGLMARFSRSLTKYSFSKVIAKFGQYSLFVYVTHLVIGQYVLAVALNLLGFAKIESKYIYGGVVIAVYIFIYCMLLCLDKIKAKHQPKSTFMRLLIGKNS